MNRHGKLAEGQTRLSVQVSTDEKQALQQAAKQDRRSLSNFLSIEVAAIVRRIKGEKTDLPHTTNPQFEQDKADLEAALKKAHVLSKKKAK